MTLASGSSLGPHEIRAPLGAGGMGEVYRALDPKLWHGVRGHGPPRGRDAAREARGRTVRNYPSEAISKLGAANRVDAARIARSKGFL